MSDFTIVQCNNCKVEDKRACFSPCSSCSTYYCSSRGINCGIECPTCLDNICARCLLNHSEKCWEHKADIVETSDGKTYYFFRPETIRGTNIKVFSSDYGVVKIFVPAD